jgi:hypothetical protein
MLEEQPAESMAESFIFVTPRGTFNSLSRDHSISGGRRYEREEVATFNSLSRDHDDDGHEREGDRVDVLSRFQLPLSGSLFEPQVPKEVLEENKLSTPSLGITEEPLIVARVPKEVVMPFNSLSRDHVSAGVRSLFESISSFQLPLSGSLADVLRFTGTDGAFNSLSRDHIHRFSQHRF